MTRTARRPGRTPTAATDRGLISLYVVAMTVGLLAMAGLVVDGGNAINARQRAADLAQQAARAGADALSPVSLRTGEPSQLRADPGAATRAADAVLSDGAVTGTVTVQGSAVTVTVTVHERTTVLSAFGLTEVTGSAAATAIPLHGTDTAGGS